MYRRSRLPPCGRERRSTRNPCNGEPTHKSPMERGRHLGSGRQGETRTRLAAVHFDPPGEIQLYQPNAKMRIDEHELFRSGPATALTAKAGSRRSSSALWSL